MSNYTVRVQEIGGDTIYYIRLKEANTPLALKDRQAPFDVPHVHWLKGGKASKTDWMKQRSYNGEQELCNSEQKRWEDFLPVAHYYGTLIQTEWFARRWPDFRELRLIYRKGTRNAWGSPKFTASGGVIEGSVTLGHWAIGQHREGRKKEGGEAVALHELAHAICPRAHWHSPLWARTYLELVKFRMGAASGAMLRRGFDKHKVRYRPYRQLTDEQRQALRERFMARGLNQRPAPATVASEGVAHAP
jgi:putative metallohydrolase (TIGR04338 family)